MFNIRVVDIQAFLEKQGYFWDGQLVDDREVNQDNYMATTRKPACLNGLKCGITPYKFIVYGIKVAEGKQQNKDWSKAWINHLIERRGQEYIPYLKRWCALQKSLVIADTMKKENLLLRAIEKMREAQKDQLKEITALDKKIYSLDTANTL